MAVDLRLYEDGMLSLRTKEFDRSFVDKGHWWNGFVMLFDLIGQEHFCWEEGAVGSVALSLRNAFHLEN